MFKKLFILPAILFLLLSACADPLVTITDLADEPDPIPSPGPDPDPNPNPNPSTVVTQIATGTQYSCSIISGGTVKCWGKNEFGQLGNDSTTDSIAAVTVSGVSSVSQISLGHGHACALIIGGTVKCWGNNRDGQLGNNSGGSEGDKSTTPVVVSGLSNAKKVFAGEFHSCALLKDNTAKCWGGNGTGQLGRGSASNSLTPVAVSSLSGITQMSAGPLHACAVVSGATVKCWGYNESGQLGATTTDTCNDEACSPAPVTVTGLSNATQVSIGVDHTCAIISGSTVKCWGKNDNGQLGDNSTTDSPTPVTVSGLNNASQLALGDRFSCAVLEDDTATTEIDEAGTVKCWGRNEWGELGNNSTTDSDTPVTVSGLSDASEIKTEDDHICALISGGTAKCWGGNAYGELGATTTDICSIGGRNASCSKTPISVDNL